MKLGKSRPLEEADLYEVRDDINADNVATLFEQSWAVEVENEKQKTKNSKNGIQSQPSLKRALHRIYAKVSTVEGRGTQSSEEETDRMQWQSI